MTASGQLRGRLRAVSRGRRHFRKQPAGSGSTGRQRSGGATAASSAIPAGGRSIIRRWSTRPRWRPIRPGTSAKASEFGSPTYVARAARSEASPRWWDGRRRRSVASCAAEQTRWAGTDRTKHTSAHWRVGGSIAPAGSPAIGSYGSGSSPSWSGGGVRSRSPVACASSSRTSRIAGCARKRSTRPSIGPI